MSPQLNAEDHSDQVKRSALTLTRNEIVAKKRKRDMPFPLSEFKAFLELVRSHPVIEDFLHYDRCYLLADNYLLSMVFIYFVRSKLPISSYDAAHFFAALYLAHDMEEDNEVLKRKLIRWCPGLNMMRKFERVNATKMQMWFDMSFKARISLYSCRKVLSRAEGKSLWERERDTGHANAQHMLRLRVSKCKYCSYRSPRSPWFNSPPTIYNIRNLDDGSQYSDLSPSESVQLVPTQQR